MHPAEPDEEVQLSALVRDGQVVRRVMRAAGGALRFTVAGEPADWHLDYATLLEVDPSFAELPQLLEGFYAERGGLGEPWRREHDHDHLHPGEDEEAERRRIAEQVARTGWYCLMVAATSSERREKPAGADFAYTVGLRDSFAGHPDLIVFDQDLDAAYDILAAVVAELEAGRRFRPGDRSPEVLDGSEVRFWGAPARARAELMTYTGWFYDREPFAALQVVWPDVEGRWPWQEGSRGAYQPALALDAPWREEELSDLARDVQADGAVWMSWPHEGAATAMTVGLEATFAHPELVAVAAGDPETALLDELIGEVRGGARLAAGEHRVSPGGVAYEVLASDPAGRRQLGEDLLRAHGVTLGALLEVRLRGG